MKELADRLALVVSLAGSLDNQDEFSREYAALLGEVQGALVLMRRVAWAQVQFLRMQAGRCMREN